MEHAEESKIEFCHFAFPAGSHSSLTNRGMSLHQWYAGMAMQGLLAGRTYNMLMDGNNKRIADHALKLADEMIKQFKPME